jgi:membrane protein required for colicin V production
MEINYFDLAIAVIVLLLGLKGILNGFFKELFGLIGIIGGIFVASRAGDTVGKYLDTLVFHFSNNAAVSFTGFLVTLAVFWLLMVTTGYIFKRLVALSGLGIFDRILGFVFASGKFFLIAAVIAFSVNNVQALKPTLEKAFGNSLLFPVLVSTGSYIMKIDPTKISKDINNSIETKTQEITKTAIEENISEIKKAFSKGDTNGSSQH